MPVYEFYCATCNHSFDVRRTLREGTDDVTCPSCTGDKVQRVFTPVMAFSKGRGGVSTIGGGGCAGCAITNCAGCPITRRK